jgi:hypothetical protein
MTDKCQKCGTPTRYINSLQMFQTICDSCWQKRDRKAHYPIDIFMKRMQKLGIRVKLTKNVPWVYLDSVNEIKIKEKFHSDHGFTAFYTPIRLDSVAKFSDMKQVFKKIREIIENGQET